MHNRLIQRIKHEVLQLSVGKSAAKVEDLQVVCYAPGEYYKAHLDEISGRGNKLIRAWALLVYLNDDFEGGETYFESIGLSIKAETGKALLFPLLNEDLRTHRLSLHAGQPVSSGKKYACNIWLRVETGNTK